MAPGGLAARVDFGGVRVPTRVAVGGRQAHEDEVAGPDASPIELISSSRTGRWRPRAGSRHAAIPRREPARVRGRGTTRSTAICPWSRQVRRCRSGGRSSRDRPSAAGMRAPRPRTPASLHAARHEPMHQAPYRPTHLLCGSEARQVVVKPPGDGRNLRHIVEVGLGQPRDHSRICVSSPTGTPMRPQMIRSGSGCAYACIRSTGSHVAAWSSRDSASSTIRGRNVAMRRAEISRATIDRSRVCSGGSSVSRWLNSGCAGVVGRAGERFDIRASQSTVRAASNPVTSHPSTPVGRRILTTDRPSSRRRA